MTAQANQQTDDPNYDVHSIDFLNNPDLAGLPANCAGMGVIRASQEGTGNRCTMLVDHDYAVMMLEARRDLGGFIAAAITAVRWVRIGWPEDWSAGNFNPAWAPVYPAGSNA